MKFGTYHGCGGSSALRSLLDAAVVLQQGEHFLCPSPELPILKWQVVYPASVGKTSQRGPYFAYYYWAPNRVCSNNLKCSVVP